MITKERILAGFTDARKCLACRKLITYVDDEETWHKTRCGLVKRENFNRIHIIGGPGSGKTTLARELAVYLEIESYELDKIAFTGPDFEDRPIVDRMTDIHAIAGRPAWVTEGLFVQWTDELMHEASIIVWLDHVNWERSTWRITKRFVRLAIREAKRRKGLEKFTRFTDYARHMKQLVQSLFASRAYYGGYPSRSTNRIESRPITAAFLKPYKGKVIHCYNDESVDAFIEYIHYCHEQCR
jgi:adenylate kinase family enzyme